MHVLLCTQPTPVQFQLVADAVNVTLSSAECSTSHWSSFTVNTKHRTSAFLSITKMIVTEQVVLKWDCVCQRKIATFQGFLMPPFVVGYLSKHSDKMVEWPCPVYVAREVAVFCRCTTSVRVNADDMSCCCRRGKRRRRLRREGLQRPLRVHVNLISSYVLFFSVEKGTAHEKFNTFPPFVNTLWLHLIQY